MTPVPASQLPDVLTVDTLGALLGLKRRAIYAHMQLPSWPFTPVPGFTNRWAKEHVLAVLAGQVRPATRLRSAS